MSDVTYSQLHYPDDLKANLDLANEAFSVLSDIFGKNIELHPNPNRFAGEEFRLIVAHHLGYVIGTCLVSVERNTSGKIGTIDWVGVLEDYRGRGVATALVAEAEKYFASNGSLQSRAYLLLSESARSFWQARGYTIQSNDYCPEVVKNI